MYFQQVVIFARYVVALGNFRYLLYPGHKVAGYIGVEFLQFDAAEHYESEIQFLSIQHCGVALYISFALQPLEPFVDRGGGEVYLRSQFFVGYA